MYIGFIIGMFFLIVGFVLILIRMHQPDYNKTTNILGLILVLVVTPLILFSFIRIVPAGTVGVFDLFGKVSDVERQSGLNLVDPFAKLIIFNIKTEEAEKL